MADSAGLTTPPHNIEAEEAVIGSVLIDPESFFDVAQFLKPDDFYIVKHRWIWGVFVALHDLRSPIDLLTVQEELERRAQLAEVGGPAYLTRLITLTPTAFNAPAYGRLVEEAATRRRLIQAASEIAKLAYDVGTDVNTVVGESEKALFGVSESRNLHELQPMRKAASEYYDRIQYLYDHRGELIGVPSGFKDLDKLLGGFQNSDLIILAGRPGRGKTSLLLSLALNAAKIYKKRIAIFSLEMANEQLVQRLVAQETGINSHRLRMGQLEDDEWPRFTQAITLLSETGVYLDDTPAISALQLRTKCRRLNSEIKLDMVVVDYLQLMTSDTRVENRVQEVSAISRNLKALARELNVPVLTAAQLSRAVEQRSGQKPMLSDLRESGCLTGDSLIYLPESGTYQPIRDLVGKADFKVLAVNTDTWKLESANVAKAFGTGIKPISQLTTRLGRTIRATANHKFLTINGWKRLEELIVEEPIALPRRLSSPDQATMYSAELGLLGHLIGDGCTLPRHAIQYTTKESDLAETVMSLARDVFGGEISPRVKQERTWYQVYLSATQHLTHDTHNPIAKWLTGLGVFGLRSYEKRVPVQVFSQPAPAIATFLRHLWATDGCINLSSSQKQYARVYYASSSEGLARDVQSLLLRLGIIARLTRHKQPGQGRDQFHVTVSGKPDLELFFAQIGGLGARKRQHQMAIQNILEKSIANTNRDIVPRDIWRKYAVPAMHVQDLTTRQLHAALGHAYCGTALYKQNVSRDRAARLAQIVRSEEIARLADSDVYWDAIVSIEPDGEEQTYDLTVDSLHNFIANNIIVHNSIEQDADIVMFLHHPDDWDEDPQKKNITEIVVAKHRNGPTGAVELVFLEQLTKFADAETRHLSFE